MMKKSSLAIGVVAALVAAWIGGSWYSGKVLQDKYPEYISNANQNVAANYNVAFHGVYRFEVKNTKLERSLFSTEIEDQLIVTDLSDNSQLVFPFKTTAEHGPLPLSRLSKLKLIPVLTSAHSELAEDPSIGELFKASKGIAPYSGDFTISYGGQIQQNSTIAAFDYRNAEISINSTPIQIKSDTNQDGVGLIKLQLDKWVSTLPANEFNDQYQAITVNRTITFDNVTLDSDLKPTDWKYVPIGKQVFDIGLISVTDEAVEGYTPDNVQLKNLKLDYETVISSGFADYRLNNSIESLVVQGENLGQVDFNFNLGHLSPEYLNQGIAAFTNPNPDEQEKQLTAAGLGLLKYQPTFSIQPLKLKNSAGENQLTFDLAFSNADQQAALMQGKFLSLFDKLEMNANLNRQSAEVFGTSISRLDGVENPETAAKAELDAALQEAVAQNALTTNDNGATYQSKLILENGELKFNGQVIPEQEIAQALMMIFMGGF
ncbi:YdgA family protein [Pasteurella testudinis]|uniref:YdgA family protein n=1 Tax=Pasteurella testudinis TaxID=761 RepID=UPI004059D9C3